MTRHSPFVTSMLAALVAARFSGSKAPTSHPTLTSVLPATTCTSAAVLALGGTDFEAGASVTLDAPSTEYFLW